MVVCAAQQRELSGCRYRSRAPADSDCTGHVDSACSIDPADTGGTWGDTIDLTQLNKSDGTLDTSKYASISASFQTTFRIVCNSADADVTVTADTLDDGVTSPPSGYVRYVDYTAQVDIKKILAV